MSASGSDLSDEEMFNLCNLLKAARVGDVEYVSQQLINGGKYVNLYDRQRCTPLHAASMESSVNHQEVVKLLLQHGAKVDAMDIHGSRPLHIASRAKNDITVKILLDHGADVNKANFTGLTPMNEAWEVGSKEVVQVLLDHGAVFALDDNIGRTSLHNASFFGRLDVIKLLLEFGANVNSKVDGVSPLHMACYQTVECLEVFDVLIDSGADVNATDRNGCTPLHLAVKVYYSSGHQFYRKLLQRGAAIDIRNLKNETPYDLCYRGTYADEIVREQSIKAEMIEHIIKLKSAGLFVDIQVNTELDFFEKTQTECFKELETIKSIEINKDFSLSTVFSNYKNPWYLKNQSLVQGLEEILHSPDLEKRLPIYTHILKNTFEKTKKRFMLLDKAYNSLNNECRREWCRKLPYLVKLKVLNYLTRKDLLNLVKSEDEH